MEDFEPTCFERESEAQQLWRLHRSAAKQAPVYAALVRNEFRPLQELNAEVIANLHQVCEYAGGEVPFYRQTWPADRAITEFGDLAGLPMLTRQEVAENGATLRVPAPPPVAQPISEIVTTGTSGPPVRVAHGKVSRGWFIKLWQRQARWFRHDPQGKFARIRLAEQLARTPAGELNADGATVNLPLWSVLGASFQTGPEIQFNASNPVQDQVEWIRKHRPDYLMTFPGLMEELALANGCQPITDSLKGLVGVSSLMTEGMRSRVESAFGVPVDQNYGLNEIGIVAARCAAGRYHVHVEHAVVEIVDDSGGHVAPGETGRILVTAINNRVMPLIRYDTGDLGTACDGPCPCGRTLPAFRDVVGRFRRFAFTPEGTRHRVNGLLDALQHLAPDRLVNLDQYQIHQRKGDHFDLLVKSRGPLADGFFVGLREAWDELNAGADGADWTLQFIEVDSIPRAAGGKMLDFNSDYYPETADDD